MVPNNNHETIIILDFGSQYTQLIARRVREAGVYCEILPFNTPASKIAARSPKGLILSGSPSSVYQEQAPRPAKDLATIASPILGICYGLQVLAFDMGGEVKPSHSREFGYARLKVTEPSSPLFKDLPAEMDVWMSHGDHVTAVPSGFAVTAITDDALNAMEDLQRGIFGVQFHPEVVHTPLGAQVLRNFIFNVCGCRGDWSPSAVIEDQVARIRSEVGGAGLAVSGLSGGVDSTVASAVVQRALGERQTCIFVDNGLLREGEFESTLALLKQSMDLNIHGVRAGDLFLNALKGVVDPETKRKQIGKVFIDVFE
ncbi:MAG TPA: glutamine-hydrolyzing GMP synthase, partial [Pyrinomonadaceae bacterium]|nr:glutamine-hydrolyzing GMP synthase [Pyrinomonadaceae bacterium]